MEERTTAASNTAVEEAQGLQGHGELNEEHAYHFVTPETAVPRLSIDDSVMSASTSSSSLLVPAQEDSSSESVNTVVPLGTSRKSNGDSDESLNEAAVVIQEYIDTQEVHDPDGRSIYRSTHRHPRTYDADTITSTQSIYDGDIEYHVENCRRYSPKYFMPNDDDEQLRLQLMHQVHLSVFASALTTVPLPSRPSRILDIGTGSGEWAIDMGETYPSTEITGIDLSPIQPTAIPSNVFFEIFDAEDEHGWTWPKDYFDLIHLRNMIGSFYSWDEITRRSYSHLKPGGYIEMIDFDDQREFASYFAADSEVHEWMLAMKRAAAISGKVFDSNHLLPEQLEKAGFVNVKVSEHNVPLGNWPTDPNVRSMARLWLVVVLAGLEAASLRPLTQTLGWEPAEVWRMCGLIREELKRVALDKKRSQGLGVRIKAVSAMKPHSPE